MALDESMDRCISFPFGYFLLGQGSVVGYAYGVAAAWEA